MNQNYIDTHTYAYVHIYETTYICCKKVTLRCCNVITMLRSAIRNYIIMLRNVVVIQSVTYCSTFRFVMRIPVVTFDCR